MTLEQLSQNYNLAVLAPEISLILFALAVLLFGAFFTSEAQSRLLPVLALLGAGVSAFATAALWDKGSVFGDPSTAIYVADNFALFFKWIFLIGLIAAILISGRFLSPRSGDSHTVAGEYYGLMMFSTVGMMFVSGARDLLVLFLGIETLSIALYVLAGFSRRRFMSNEASLKYFLLGAFAAGFLLYGIALVYFATGSTLFPNIATAISQGQITLADGTLRVVPQPILYIGMALLLIGLGFKAALVPFHQWTPDVYEGSPTPVTAFMAVGAKAAAFAGFLHVFPGVFGALYEQWLNVVLVIAVLTMTVGNIIAISQGSLKRMLAYSSIAHAGYLLVGVLAASAARHGATPNLEAARDAIGGVLFYLVAYALMNMGAFAVLVYLENARDVAGAHLESDDANITINDLSGLAWRQPLIAGAMTVFLLSLAGIPPTAGFFGKFIIFREAMHQGLIGLVLVGVLNTVISVYYYLRPVMSMYKPDEAAQNMGSGDILVESTGGGVASLRSVAQPLSLGIVLAIVLCAIAVIGMVVLQAAVFPLAQDAAGLSSSVPVTQSAVSPLQ